MKLHEKIRHIRKNILKLSLKEFHEKLVSIYSDDALTYDSLMRLEKGYREDIRLSSLDQICTGFGMTLKELKEGTEGKGSKIVSIMKYSERDENNYVYNEKAIGVIVSPGNIKFLTMELDIMPGGRTSQEEDPLDVNKYEKLVVALHGTLLVHVGDEKHLIKRGDSLAFASNLPHYFENPSAKIKAHCMVIQNPKSY